MIEEGVLKVIAKKLQADIKKWRSLRGVLSGDLKSFRLSQ